MPANIDSMAYTGDVPWHRQGTSLDNPMTSEQAITAGGLAWDHGDPFDRMLAAQALAENLTLVSRDAAFGALRGLKVLW